MEKGLCVYWNVINDIETPTDVFFCEAWGERDGETCAKKCEICDWHVKYTVAFVWPFFHLKTFKYKDFVGHIDDFYINETLSNIFVNLTLRTLLWYLSFKEGCCSFTCSAKRTGANVVLTCVAYSRGIK